MIEEIKDFKTTPLECDRRTWVYSNGNSITFSEIERDLNSKLKNMSVRIYSEYDVTDLRLDPIVTARFESKDGYIKTIMLEKKIFKERNTYNGYYDYIIKQITYMMARAMFIKENEYE